MYVNYSLLSLYLTIFQLYRRNQVYWWRKNHRASASQLTSQGRIQDFKLGGANLKKIAPSGGRRENFWGISCEIIFFPILGGRRVPPPGSAPASNVMTFNVKFFSVHIGTCEKWVGGLSGDSQWLHIDVCVSNHLTICIQDLKGSK